jgi:transposase
MGRAYSLDLRERVVAAVAAGESCRAVATTFKVSVASVVKWSQRFRATGCGGSTGGRQSPLRAEFRERSAGAKLFFLPPYSPDLNPIEQVFAKLKTLLRKAAERTVEATWKRIATLLTASTPKECANYFVNAGYAST